MSKNKPSANICSVCNSEPCECPGGDNHLKEGYTGKGNHKPGWMLRADSALAAKFKQKKEAEKAKGTGTPSTVKEESQGDKEHKAFVKTMAAFRLKQAEKAGKKKSQDWYNKQVRLKNEETEIQEQAPTAPTLYKHRIGVTVSDPNHTMASQRKEKIQKFVRVTHGDSKEGARAVGEKFYKKRGYIVHDSHHAGLVNEEVELDEAVNEKQIKKDLDSGMSHDAVIGKHANKNLTNTNEIRKVIQKHAWDKRMKKGVAEGLDEAMSVADKSRAHEVHKVLKSSDSVGQAYGLKIKAAHAELKKKYGSDWRKKAGIKESVKQTLQQWADAHEKQGHKITKNNKNATYHAWDGTKHLDSYQSVREEVELNELSKDTLKSYQAQATGQAITHSAKVQMSKDSDTINKHAVKANKRMVGAAKAHQKAAVKESLLDQIKAAAAKTGLKAKEYQGHEKEKAKRDDELAKRPKPGPSKATGDNSMSSPEAYYKSKKSGEYVGDSVEYENTEVTKQMNEQKYVVKYNNPKSEKHGSLSTPLSKDAAHKKAEQGNKVDKTGGRYTVHPTTEKGHMESTEEQMTFKNFLKEWKVEGKWEKTKDKKDEYGNPVKTQNLAKHLAKKAQKKSAEDSKKSSSPMENVHKESVEQIDELRPVKQTLQQWADAHEKQGVAEGYEDRKKAPGWHSASVKNPNFNDELSNRRVSPPGKRLKSGKLSADERGSQERTKALIKFKQKQGGLTGPKGPLPEEQGHKIKDTVTKTVSEGFKEMMAYVNSRRASQEKQEKQEKGATGKFDKKKTSTGTEYHRKSSTFSDSDDEASDKKADKKKQAASGEAPVKRGRGRPAGSYGGSYKKRSAETSARAAAKAAATKAANRKLRKEALDDEFVIELFRNLEEQKDWDDFADLLNCEEFKCLTEQENTLLEEQFIAHDNLSESDLDGIILEVLGKDAKAGDWIKDFIKSDNPRFEDKSKAKRKEMALAAYYAKQRGE